MKNLIHAHIAQFYMGTMMMNIRDFDIVWPKQSNNREINLDHINKLIDKFKSEIHRCAAKTRLKALTSCQKFYDCIRPQMQLLEHANEAK